MTEEKAFCMTCRCVVHSGDLKYILTEDEINQMCSDDFESIDGDILEEGENPEEILVLGFCTECY